MEILLRRIGLGYRGNRLVHVEILLRRIGLGYRGNRLGFRRLVRPNVLRNILRHGSYHLWLRRHLLGLLLGLRLLLLEIGLDAILREVVAQLRRATFAGAQLRAPDVLRLVRPSRRDLAGLLIGLGGLG